MFSFRKINHIVTGREKMLLAKNFDNFLKNTFVKKMRGETFPFKKKFPIIQRACACATYCTSTLKPAWNKNAMQNRLVM